MKKNMYKIDFHHITSSTTLILFFFQKKKKHPVQPKQATLYMLLFSAEIEIKLK